MMENHYKTNEIFTLFAGHVTILVTPRDLGSPQVRVPVVGVHILQA